MIKLLKKSVGPLVSIFFLLNMTSAGYAETTVSAEVGFIFNKIVDNSSFFLVYNFLFPTIYCVQKTLILLINLMTKNPLK